MLQPLSRVSPTGAIDTPKPERADHSMDVLQYGLALLALVVAALLATLH